MRRKLEVQKSQGPEILEAYIVFICVKAGDSCQCNGWSHQNRTGTQAREDTASAGEVPQVRKKAAFSEAGQEAVRVAACQIDDVA